jgi:hypothetical protein
MLSHFILENNFQHVRTNHDIVLFDLSFCLNFTTRSNWLVVNFDSFAKIQMLAAFQVTTRRCKFLWNTSALLFLKSPSMVSSHAHQHLPSQRNGLAWPQKLEIINNCKSFTMLQPHGKVDACTNSIPSSGLLHWSQLQSMLLQVP